MQMDDMNVLGKIVERITRNRVPFSGILGEFLLLTVDYKKIDNDLDLVKYL